MIFSLGKERGKNQRITGTDGRKTAVRHTIIYCVTRARKRAISGPNRSETELPSRTIHIYILFFLTRLIFITATMVISRTTVMTPQLFICFDCASSPFINNYYSGKCY